MKKFAILTVHKRIREIEVFLVLVSDYFNSLSRDNFGNASENPISIKLRSQINAMVQNIEFYVSQSDTSDSYQYRASLVAGGYIQNIPLIQNIFSLVDHKISYLPLIDILERSLSDYRNDIPSAWVRTFNPFYWLGLLISAIVNIPFKLLTSSGFKGENISQTLFGKLFIFIFKGFFWLLGLFIAGYIAKFIQTDEIPPFVKKIFELI